MSIPGIRHSIRHGTRYRGIRRIHRIRHIRCSRGTGPWPRQSEPAGGKSETEVASLEHETRLSSM